MIWGLGAERGEVFRCTETDSVLQKRSRPASLAGVTGGTSGYACRQGCSKGITGRQWLLGPPASKPTKAATHNDQGVGAPLASLGSPWAEAMAALCGAQPFPAQTWPSLPPDKPLVCLPLLRELFSKIKSIKGTSFRLSQKFLLAPSSAALERDQVSLLGDGFSSVIEATPN